MNLNNHQQLACLPEILRVWGLLQLECVIKHLDLDLPREQPQRIQSSLQACGRLCMLDFVAQWQCLMIFTVSNISKHCSN